MKAHLLFGLQTNKVAWIQNGDITLVSAWDDLLESKIKSAHELIGYGPLVHLVREVQSRFFSNSRSVLRQPIYLNYELGPVEWAVMKVCAKRTRRDEWTESKQAFFLNSSNDRKSPNDLKEVHLDLSYLKSQMIQRLTHDKAIELAQALASEGTTKQESFFQDKKVGTVILNEHDELISEGRHLDSSHHAEMMAVESYVLKHQKKIPQGSKIFTTLKPCKMCSAVILSSCEDPSSVTVYYLNDDPGPMARNTALEPNSFLRQKFFARETADCAKLQVFKYLSG